MLGKTGVDVTILNGGPLRVPGSLDRLLRFSYSCGIRFFDTAASYGTEGGFKKWFAATPEVRKQILELRAALLDAGPMMSAACDGRCGRAAGTTARLGDLTRFLTYHEHHGSRDMARRAYAELTEEERNWHGADLDAARAACPTELDFARLLPEADRLLG